MRVMYGWLILLHPPSFRRQFGAEMELIFEESGFPVGLIADAFVSLLRQWCLRTRLWVFAAASVGGMIPLAWGLGLFGVSRRWLSGNAPQHMAPAIKVSEPANEAFLLLTATIAVLFIGATMAFSVTWFRYSQRRRKA